jgi:hypothetical protein
MEETIAIKKSEIADLVKLANEMNDRVESLELMGNKKFLKSFKRAKEQIKKRDFANWDAL